ncbi:MAG: hypothetical protein V1909_06975 [Candidatus Micrarchaeota archaeon]
MRIWILLLLIGLLFGCSGKGTSPGKAALVVDFQNSTVIKKCVEFQENSTALDLLKSAGLSIETKDDPAFGPGLCGIEGVGCSSSKCFCDSKKYWGFYYDSESGNWSYSNVGAGSLFDGNRTIVRDRAVVGFRWGEFGQLPENARFEDICLPG